MPHYRDLAGKLHFLDDAAFAYLLPAGVTKISDEDAAQQRAADAQIASPKQDSLIDQILADPDGLAKLKEALWRA